MQPPRVLIGDVGYEYFSTCYGCPHCKHFVVEKVTPNGKSIILKFESREMITFTWRKGPKKNYKFVPKKYNFKGISKLQYLFWRNA